MTGQPHRDADAAELWRRIDEAGGDLATLERVANVLEERDTVAAKWLHEYVAAIRATLETGAKAKWRTEMDEHVARLAAKDGGEA